MQTTQNIPHLILWPKGEIRKVEGKSEEKYKSKKKEKGKEKEVEGMDTKEREEDERTVERGKKTRIKSDCELRSDCHINILIN